MRARISTATHAKIRCCARPFHGLTLVEALIAISLVSILLVGMWNSLGKLFSSDGPMSLQVGASRSVVLQQSRGAIRKLFYRIQEGIQIETPFPGQSQREMAFRDIRNHRVRIRLVEGEHRLVTERLVDGVSVRESRMQDPTEAARGIEVACCESAVFTAISPTSVWVSFTTFDEKVRDTFMTVISMANLKLDD